MNIYKRSVLLRSLLCSLILIFSRVGAFTSLRVWHSRKGSGNVGNGEDGSGNGKNPPPPRNFGNSFFDDWKWNGDESNINNICMAAGSCILDMSSSQNEKEDEESMSEYNGINGNKKASFDDILLLARGGSTKSTHVLERSSSTRKKTESWTENLYFLPRSLRSRINRLFNSARVKETSMPQPILIQSVTAPNSTILPRPILRSTAQRCGLLGSAVTKPGITALAKSIKAWYSQRGYVYHSMIGAKLHMDGSLNLVVREPKVATTPINITYVKEVPVDPQTGEVTTLRKYRRVWERSRGPAQIENKDAWKDAVNDLNFTLVKTRGRTSPRSVAQGLGLLPGAHFRWDRERWNGILRSGIFSKVFGANPSPMEDGTVQLHITAQEAPPRNLEYGISKSLYTGSWEGELDFSHRNLLGGGEKLGLVVRRGTKDKEPSIKIRLADDHFMSAGGYSIELFNDYISTDDSLDNNNLMDTEMEYNETSSSINRAIDAGTNKVIVDQEDPLLCRKGLTYNVYNPISRNRVRQSASSLSLERTTTRNGRHESIGSVALDLGPYQSYLPLGSKANIATRLTSGTRIAERSFTDSGGNEEGNGDSNPDSSWHILPYISGSVTTRQIFPFLNGIFSLPSPSSSSTDSNNDSKGMTLALHHSVFTSTQNLPRHEANAAGFAARVRGYRGSSNEPIASSISGTAEIRIPISIPIVNEGAVVQDANIVLFGDWMFAIKRKQQQRSQSHSKWEDIGIRQSCVGIGLRKTVQGIPLKYDISYDTMNAKIGASLGLGSDWDI